MDINANYSEEDNPLSLKADFILSLCELVVGGKEGLLPVEKTVIDRCVHLIYRKYFADPCPENMTTTPTIPMAADSSSLRWCQNRELPSIWSSTATPRGSRPFTL